MAVCEYGFCINDCKSKLYYSEKSNQIFKSEKKTIFMDIDTRMSELTPSHLVM